MKKISILVLFMTLAVFASVQQVQAKWWIFGKSVDEVSLNYMYINKAFYEDMNGKAILFKNSLANNEIVINGKATVKKSKIGAVMVSLDNKETWTKATLSDNGSFEYKFQPDTTKNYDFYLKVIDTTGKTNDIEKTYVQITFSDQDISLLARETLDKLFKAYQSENTQAFMALVSENFVPGSDILDSAVRKDFLLFDYIKIEHFINNISQVADGKIFISFQYNRSVISTKTGQTFTDKGITELVLKNEGGQLKLYSMKNPLMFGLSDASEIATGSVNQSSNDDMIVVENPSGTIKVLPYNEAIKDIYGEDDATVKTVTLNHGNSSSVNLSYDFDTETIYDTTNNMINNIGTHPHIGAGGVFQELSVTDITTTPFPTSGYNNTTGELGTTPGSCWAIDYGARGKVILKIKSYGTLLIFDYKYQQ
jgi:hypothetical protein